MECRTKVAINIIAGLTKKEAFELFDLIRVIEKKFKENRTGLGLKSLDRETTVTFVNDIINGWIKTGELEIPPHLNDSFKSFIKLMVSERAQLDELVFEYNRALCPVLQYDFFKEDKKMEDTDTIYKHYEKEEKEMEYIDIFKSEDGTEVEIKMKAECHTEDEMNAAISFMAQSSRKFYLQVAEKISNTL